MGRASISVRFSIEHRSSKSHLKFIEHSHCLQWQKYTRHSTDSAAAKIQWFNNFQDVRDSCGYETLPWLSSIVAIQHRATQLVELLTAVNLVWIIVGMVDDSWYVWLTSERRLAYGDKSRATNQSQKADLC